MLGKSSNGRGGGKLGERGGIWADLRLVTKGINGNQNRDSVLCLLHLSCLLEAMKSFYGTAIMTKDSSSTNLPDYGLLPLIDLLN